MVRLQSFGCHCSTFLVSNAMAGSEGRESVWVIIGGCAATESRL
jgi:hypothetical protein